MYVPTQTPPQKVGYSVVRCSLSRETRKNRTDRSSRFFNLFFLLLLPNNNEKKNTLFFCVLQKHIIITFYYCCYYTNTLSLLSLCWGKGPPSSRTRIIQLPATRNDAFCALEFSERKQSFDSRFWKHINYKPPPKIGDIYSSQARVYFCEKTRGGERKARQRNAKKARQKEIKYGTNRPSRRGRCHG